MTLLTKRNASPVFTYRKFVTVVGMGAVGQCVKRGAEQHTEAVGFYGEESLFRRLTNDTTGSYQGFNMASFRDFVTYIVDSASKTPPEGRTFDEQISNLTKRFETPRHEQQSSAKKRVLAYIKKLATHFHNEPLILLSVKPQDRETITTLLRLFRDIETRTQDLRPHYVVSTMMGVSHDALVDELGGKREDLDVITLMPALSKDGLGHSIAFSKTVSEADIRDFLSSFLNPDKLVVVDDPGKMNTALVFASGKGLFPFMMHQLATVFEIVDDSANAPKLAHALQTVEQLLTTLSETHQHLPALDTLPPLVQIIYTFVHGLLNVATPAFELSFSANAMKAILESTREALEALILTRSGNLSFEEAKVALQKLKAPVCSAGGSTVMANLCFGDSLREVDKQALPPKVAKRLTDSIEAISEQTLLLLTMALPDPSSENLDSLRRHAKWAIGAAVCKGAQGDIVGHVQQMPTSEPEAS